MRKIFKFPILILAALSINIAYSVTEDLTAPKLRLSNLTTKSLTEQLELTNSPTLATITKFLGINPNDFDQILIDYMSHASDIPNTTSLISVNPHEKETDNPVNYVLMHDFLLVTENATELPKRLSSIIDLLDQCIYEEKHGLLKDMLCHIALTRTHIKQAKDLITQAIKLYDIKFFRLEILRSETLLRAIYDKKSSKAVLKLWNSTAETRRKELTGESALSDFATPYEKTSKTTTQDPMAAWSNTFIENMLKGRYLQTAVSQDRIRYNHDYSLEPTQEKVVI